MMTGTLPRALALQGASNVRDLGGWPREDGGRVRFGHVFRSAALTGLTARDAAALAATGLRTVCDLRGRLEAAEAPSALGGVAGAIMHALPIEPSVGASLRDLVATRTASGENVMAVMRQAYVAYALEWPHRYRAIFALLADEDSAPLLLHCSAGKDRTGFGAALILTALGVPYEAVRQDYLASNLLWRGDAGIAGDLPASVAETLLRVHPELLDAAFAAIAGAYGGFARYASVTLEMDAARLARLRARLVE
ncbi:MAG TPA: tyrosine-protein phosphatase [Acetobacteraceae bacterium]